MKYLKYSILGAILLSSLSLFAQKSKEGWIKRGWNNMIAHYNIYFNAEQKFNASLDKLYDMHKDDFEEILPVFPYADESAAKQMRAPMEEAMKKASKVIQSKPKSKWVDDSYFLIGQTHFFRDDQFAAIEMFQFVYSKFQDPTIKSKAQLWVMKSYLRQGKYNDAEAILGLIRESPIDDKHLKTQIHLVAGDLYVKQGKYQLAIEELEKGVPTVKDKTLKYRVHFILGQLCLESEEYTKANEHFVKVLKMNAPYEYVFQANLGLTRATSESGGKGIKSTKKYLKRMLNDDKNIDYFDQIYYELALLEFTQGNEAQGLDYMLKSSKNANSNAKQQTKTYLYLADYFFTKRDYTRSQNYYDSAVGVLPLDYPNYDKITAKHAVLSNLIENIETVYVQDSLLALAALPREELDAKIAKLAAEEARKKRLAEEEERLRQERDRLNPTKPSVGGAAGTPGSGNVWYFYNASTVARGENEFARVWGSRKYGDWWRFKNKTVTDDASSATPKDTDNPLSYNSDKDKEQQDALKDVSEDKLKYYENIPFSSTSKLLANNKIQNALIEMGKIYYNDLREYRKSIASIEKLLTRYKESIHRPEGLFYLAKAYQAIGDSNKYDQYALQIAEEYPTTTFNQVLNNKEVTETGEDDEVIKLYEEMYAAYVKEDFKRVEKLKHKVDTAYAGNLIQAKFDYLYALVVGKTKGKKAYLEELEAIKENYPGTDIANMAQYTITLLTTEKITEAYDISMYSTDFSGVHYYIITGTAKDIQSIQLQLTEYNEKFFPGSTFQIKNLIFGDRQLFYVKQFENKAKVENYHREMKANYSFLVEAGLNDLQNYSITEENFKALIKSQKEAPYIYFHKKHYPFEL